MRFFLYPILACLFAFPAKGQSPGGIGTNNTMWLRSDVGLTAAAGIVSQWQELSGANVTGNFTVQSLTGTVNTQTGPALIDAGINFNPYIRFDGITNSLSGINLFPGTSLVSNSNVTVFQVFNLKGGIVWLRWETDQAGAAGRLGFENTSGKIRFDFPKALPAAAGQNVGTINVLNKHSLATSFADATTSVNRLNGANNTTLVIPGAGDFAATTDKIVIGNENLINLPAQVDIAEVIIYNTTLTAAQRNKIESYLAIKYGFTLDQAAANANDYTASDGSITWNRAANSAYAKDITGIGRDDASGLNQKQSKSINASALITLYNGDDYLTTGLSPTNAGNNHNFADDNSFLLVGDNGASVASGPCTFKGAKRIQRIWKVSKKNGVNDFPVHISVDVGAIQTSLDHLIVSTDPTFPEATTNSYPLTEAANKLYAELVLHNGEYFTFATDTLHVNLVGLTPACGAPGSGNVTTTVTGNYAPLTYSWSPSGQVTANLVNVIAGTYTLTVTQAGCQSTDEITLPDGQVPPLPIITGATACPGYSTTLTIQNVFGGFAYTWYFIDGDGNISALGTGPSYTTPSIVTNAVFYIETVDHTCSSGLIPVNIDIYPPPDLPIINTNTQICQGSSATLTILNPVAGYSYSWFTETGYSLGSGTSYTTPALFADTTIYFVKLYNGNCFSERIYDTVTVEKLDAPKSTAVVICTGNTALLSVDEPNPNPSYTYNWYSTPTGGTALGAGVNFTTAIISIPTTYYVEMAHGACRSNRTPVKITLAPELDTPIVSVANVTNSSITFSWLPVAGAVSYQVSVDGSSYGTASSGGAGLTHTVSGLPEEQTVTIAVVAIAIQGCGESDAGHAAATTYGHGFYVPSAFTPNGDTRNDVFKPKLPGGCSLEYFTVYNRWGQKIFSTSVPGVGWDGKLKGMDQSPGTYVWLCRYRFGNGAAINEKGSFIIIR
ncbi:MAG: gliding motility-associated C-terminal domain-containing protein [Ferruginibacter sp.]